MKKILITTLLLCALGHIMAQSYTESFNEVFQHVDLDHTSTGILYERVLPFSKLISYVTNNSQLADTCDYGQFIMAYDELYRAGAQYTFLSDSVEEMIRQLPIDNEIVVLGMMHAKFNTFDTVAIRQRLYFDADSVLRENTSVNVSLFNEKIAFMMAPLVNNTISTSVKFIIDHHFSFDNTTNPVSSLLIDFGDGCGERNVMLDSYVNIYYSSRGIKIIRIAATYQDNSTDTIYAKIIIGEEENGLRSTPPTNTQNYTVYGNIQPYFPYYKGGSFICSRGDIRIYLSFASSSSELEISKINLKKWHKTCIFN